jgi:predicted kinase
MATIILLCGLPGSGKTTLATQLARDRPALRLGEDDWMVQLFASADGHGDAEREAIKQVQWEIATQVARFGVDVVLDWGYWSRQERDDYRARVRRPHLNRRFEHPRPPARGWRVGLRLDDRTTQWAA